MYLSHKVNTITKVAAFFLPNARCMLSHYQLSSQMYLSFIEELQTAAVSFLQPLCSHSALNFTSAYSCLRIVKFFLDNGSPSAGRSPLRIF